MPQSNKNISYRNSNLLNIQFKNNSVDKNIHSYYENVEMEDKNLNDKDKNKE